MCFVYHVVMIIRMCVCVFFLSVVVAISFARFVVLVVFVQTTKNIKPRKTYKNLQEPAKTYKNMEMNINTQQTSTQLSNTLAVPRVTRPAQHHCGRVAIQPYGMWHRGPALRR